MIVLPVGLNVGAVVKCFFDTYNTAGASVTITGLAVTDIEIYKEGSITQRASDNGYALLDTDGIDFDGNTGLHGFSINTGDNSDAGFWTDGAQYLIHVNAITVDAQTVRFSYLLWLGLVGSMTAVNSIVASIGTPADFGGGSATLAGNTADMFTVIQAAHAGVINANSVLDDLSPHIPPSGTISTHTAANVVTAMGTGSTLTALATQASVNTIDDFLDSEVAAILAAVDTEVAALVTAVAGIPAAWGSSVVGAGRTRDYFLQGGTNKISFDVPGAGQYTIYATDDSTPLKVGTYTATAGADPVTVLDPA